MSTLGSRLISRPISKLLPFTRERNGRNLSRQILKQLYRNGSTTIDLFKKPNYYQTAPTLQRCGLFRNIDRKGQIRKFSQYTRNNNNINNDGYTVKMLLNIIIYYICGVTIVSYSIFNFNEKMKKDWQFQNLLKKIDNLGGPDNYKNSIIREFMVQRYGKELEKYFKSSEYIYAVAHSQNENECIFVILKVNGDISYNRGGVTNSINLEKTAEIVKMFNPNNSHYAFECYFKNKS